MGKLTLITGDASVIRYAFADKYVQKGMIYSLKNEGKKKLKSECMN